MIDRISARTLVAGVVGHPVRHSLSPAIHNAWIAEAGLDAVYVAFCPALGAFGAFARGFRGGIIRGLNVTAPFKEEALAVADELSGRARDAGSANLLIFAPDGRIVADNTDGEGLLAAFRRHSPGFEPAAGPVTILGAGGAARGAAAAFLGAGAPVVNLVNRRVDRARELARELGDRAHVFSQDDAAIALRGAAAVINATPQGLNDAPGPSVPLEVLEPGALVMDMVYRPVRTRLLKNAAALGLGTVDGLSMLIGQAEPSFEAFFARPPPQIDIRSLVLADLES